MAELTAGGALVDARHRAEAMVATARAELAKVPAGAARDALDAAALAIVHRDF
jgi:geranylgeranyl pyrophosphate synthase